MKSTIPQTLLSQWNKKKTETLLRLYHNKKPCNEYNGSDLLDSTLRWAKCYEASGIKQGDQIIIILKHSIDLYTSFTGAIFAGIVPSLFAYPSPKMSNQDYISSLNQLIKNADPKLIVTYPELANSCHLSVNIITPEAINDLNPLNTKSNHSKRP